jgi:hypothetical protein
MVRSVMLLIVGAVLGAATTVTLAVAVLLLLVAVTVKGPPTVVAVKRPLGLMVPPPLTLQVGETAIVPPN